jgi:hypothetical protein
MAVEDEGIRGDASSEPEPSPEESAGASGGPERIEPIEEIELGDLRLTPLKADFSLGRLLDSIAKRVVEFRVPVRRPDDFLVFDLLVDNLELQSGDAPRLVRSGRGPSRLIVELPPQSFGEEAFLEVPAPETDVDKEPKNLKSRNVPVGTTEAVPPLPSARVRMSGPSRLAFNMPDRTIELPFTLAAVLDAMRTWPLSLDACAMPDPNYRLDGIFDGLYLGEIATSGGWLTTVSYLSSALEAAGARGFERALVGAARRVAERSAGGLRESARNGLGGVMLDAIHGELDALHREFPVLRQGPFHQAGIAALALASAGALADAASRVADTAGIAVELPWLPLLLAPHEPSRKVTAIELPYRLILTPIEAARWRHRDAPFTHLGRTELWHTRLATAAGVTGPDGPTKVRAIWSPDYPAPAPEPFRGSLAPLDRKMLVQLMAGFDEKRADKVTYKPRAARNARLHLSALGGLLDSEGDWEKRPALVDIEQWRHLATLGRDHYVRVVYAGRLFPFGHSASLVKVTERKFESLDANRRATKKRIAVLRQRFFLIVRERVREYDGTDHEFSGRNFAFTRVEILTRVTPDLEDPGKPGTPSALVPVAPDVIFDPALPIVPRMAFWPISAGMSVRFEVATIDRCGRQASFSLPLLFVGETANWQKSAEIRRAYNAPATVSRRTANLGGATVCYAPCDGSLLGDPCLPTDELTFWSGALRSGPHPLDPNVYPEVSRTQFGVPALQKLLGQNVIVSGVYAEAYRDHGFGGDNPGQVFLELKPPLPLPFGGGPGQAKSDALGALAAPQMSIFGLSRVMGPVAAKPAGGSLAKAVGGQFDPADFFDGATILGGVDLGAILDVVVGLAGANVPKLLSRELPDRIEASFSWDTEIKKSDPLNLLIPRADGGSETRLVMNGLVTTPLADPSQAAFRATASIGNFKINLFGCIILWFESLRFVAEKGQKPDVAVQLKSGDDAVRFGGPLEFVNTLRHLIPSNGFSDPPGLSITPSGIRASYSLNLPTIGVGVFTLSNASLGAGFELPFDARPASVKFNFSEREHPFSLTVSLLGGGGFFAIGVSARGVQEIEAALEVGAALAIDLGVASGSVEVKVGIYFHWLQPAPSKGSVELAGYVRIHGELSVLAIISVSLTFNLQIAYLKDQAAHRSVVWGEATLVVEIEVLFFSFDVSVRCRREFAGGESDPKFIDLIPDLATWTDYCEAFAEEGV